MYMRPAEWHTGKTIWLAWPFDQSLWGDDLYAAQREFISLVHALSSENLVVMVPNKDELVRMSGQIPNGPHIALKVIPYGDIWLRDTLPIFVKDEHGHTVAVIPTFNGWGNKYLFDDDRDLSVRVANLLLIKKVFSKIVFEGGAIESDGAGTILTTEQCLLNPNRNPSRKKDEIEENFKTLFGASKVIWLKAGLKNDHTDGHIDTIARFIGPQRIAIMTPRHRSDPNYDVLMDIKETLSDQSDAHGNKFELIEIPSPGVVLNRDGQIMPASYLNFLMGDETLVVPLYGSVYDQEAVALLKQAVKLNVIGISARFILTGGGAFHCISQEYYH
jgi:agmatine deiminase